MTHTEFHEGLAADLRALARQNVRRRLLLRGLGAAPLAGLPLAGCGGTGETSSTAASTAATAAASSSAASSSTASSSTASSSTASSSTASSSTASSTASSSTASGTSGSAGSPAATCTTVPEETAGPYPGDGSNASSNGVANALALTGIVRSDIRSSIAGASGVAAGVPLTLKIQLLNSTGSACGVLAGYAIYAWHCDRDGNYSMYASSLVNENYLRGVQATDSTGTATFVTIFPGCYSGRMPHVHFEVYRSLASATGATSKLRTSQLAFPNDVSQAVYATASGYSTSARNLAQISFATDNVFSDGYSLQLVSITGNVTDGYVATIAVAIAA